MPESCWRIALDIATPIAAFGALGLSIYQEWRTRHKDRVRLAIRAGFGSGMTHAPNVTNKGITVTVVNTGYREAAISGIYFGESEESRFNVNAETYDLPRVLPPGRSAEFLFPVSSWPEPLQKKLAKAKWVEVRTECGKTFQGGKGAFQEMARAMTEGNPGR